MRRDNCRLVRDVISTCLDKILIDRDVAGAVDYVKGQISDLLMNRMDLSVLVVSKSLSRAPEDYAVKSAHVELAKRMMKRDPATAPAVGDRVAYVIIKGPKGAKSYEKAEDPIYALDNNLPIDCQHYLEHFLSQPLMRIFEPTMKNPKSLLTGEHTRCIKSATPSNRAGGIMQFAKVTLKCLGCKAALPPGQKSLCKHCQGKKAELFQTSLTSLNELQAHFTKLWVQCQRCSGSLHQDVLCTNRDCPIFYRRKKVQKDLKESVGVMQRYEW